MSANPEFWSSNMADHQRKLSRSTTIARFETILQISQLTSPVLGAALMSVDVFLPMMVALPLTTLALPLILFALPARSSRKKFARQTSETEPLLVVEETPPPGSAEHGRAIYTNSTAQAERKSSRSSLLSCPIIIWATLSFFVAPFGRQLLKISTQYASNRFELSIAQIRPFACAIICCLQVVIPCNSPTFSSESSRTKPCFLLCSTTG